MTLIRLATPDDLEDVYWISARTGNSGEDESHLLSDHKLVGHIYSAPYLLFEPELSFVAESDGKVLGFVVGTTDTIGFAKRLEEEWWPALRRKYPKPDVSNRASWSADEHRCHSIHTPEITPEQVLSDYPAHLHMNLLPALQGQGAGSLLWNAWREKAVELGARAAHIGASSENTRAVKFWGRLGFEPLIEVTDETGAGTVWKGCVLD